MTDQIVDEPTQESSPESGTQKTSEVEDEDVSKKKPQKKRAKGRAKKKAPKKKAKVKYNTDIHSETGAMQLQELLYYRLVVAEQQIKIQERDLHIAKTQVKEFQVNANAQLATLQSKVKENSVSLQNARMGYIEVVRDVEQETGLSLKDWAVDDERILRPVEKEGAS